MNFSYNLQKIRKEKGLSQEQLAEKLDVSRQSVSKWESGAAYPELEKIMLISDIFGCSMDSLIKGEYKIDKSGEDVLKAHKKFAFMIASGVFLCIFAVSVLILISGLTSESSVIGISFFLLITLVAVSLFVYNGIIYGNDEIEKKIQKIEYSFEEKKLATRKFALAISGGIALIIFSIILLISLENIVEEFLLTSTFMTLVGISVFMFVYFGINQSRFQYSKNSLEDVDGEELKNKKRKEKIIEKTSSVIMLSATFIFLFLGFMAWIVFPLGGILCGIVSVVVE